MFLEDQMKFHELQAMWWMHSASNGTCTKRNIYKGLSNHKLTADELKHDAMETSQIHIGLFLDCAEHLQKEKDKD